MKIILITLILLFSIADLSAQTPCGDLSAQPGKWVKEPIAGKDALAIKNVNTAMSLFQNSVTGFKGGQAKTYVFTSGWIDTRPYKFQSYTVTMYFLQFECIDKKIKPESATDTWLYIGFNQIPFFTSNNTLEGDFFRLANGQQMFFSDYKLEGNYKGMTKISPIHHTDAQAVFLSKSNRLPFRAVTQTEILTVYKKFFAAQKTKFISWQENILVKDPGNKRSREIIDENRKEIERCNSTIDSFLKRPSVNSAAFVEVVDHYCNPEKMFIPQNHPRARSIVVFDDSHFDKSLPSAAPQFIVVYWRSGDANYKTREGEFRYPLKREFIRKFEENFDFEALKKMLGK